MPDRPVKPSAMPGVVETVDDAGNPILVPLETAQRLGLTSADVSGVAPQPQGAAAALQSVLGAGNPADSAPRMGGQGASAPIAQDVDPTSSDSVMALARTLGADPMRVNEMWFRNRPTQVNPNGSPEERAISELYRAQARRGAQQQAPAPQTPPPDQGPPNIDPEPDPRMFENEDPEPNPAMFAEETPGFDPNDPAQAEAMIREFGADPRMVRDILNGTNESPPELWTGEGEAERVIAALEAANAIRPAVSDVRKQGPTTGPVPATKKQLPEGGKQAGKPDDLGAEWVQALGGAPGSEALLTPQDTGFGPQGPALGSPGVPSAQQAANAAAPGFTPPAGTPPVAPAGAPAAPRTPIQQPGTMTPVDGGGVDPFVQADQANLGSMYGLAQVATGLALRQGQGGTAGAARIAGQLRSLLPQIQGLSDQERAAFEAFLGDLQKTGRDQDLTATKLAGIEDDAADQLAQEQAEYHREVSSLQETHAQRVKDLERAVNDFSGLAVDPDRLFGSAPVATQFSAALGIAVGEALKTAQNIFFPGTNATNVALNLVNTAIDRSIEGQRLALQKGAQTIQGRQSLVGATQDQLQNAAAADATAKAALLKRAELQVSAMIHQGMGQDAVNKMQTLVDQLKQQRLAQELAAKQALAAQLQQQLARAGRGRGINLDDVKTAFDMAYRIAEMSRDGGQRLGGTTDPSGIIRFRSNFDALPAEQQNAAINEVRRSYFMIQHLNSMEGLLDRAGTWTSPGARRAGAVQAWYLMDQLRNTGFGASAGAYDAGLQRLFEDAGLDINSTNPAEANVTGSLRSVIRELRSIAQRRADSQIGVAPGPNLGIASGREGGVSTLPQGVTLVE